MITILDLQSQATQSFEYNANEVMAKAQLCKFYLVSPHENMRLVAGIGFFDDSHPSELFDIKTAEEIFDYLHSWSNKLMICAAGKSGEAAVVVPTLFPSSSLVPILIFDREQLTLDELLRLAQCEESRDMFVISGAVKQSAARMTETLMKKKDAFLALCEELTHCLLGKDYDSGADICNDIYPSDLSVRIQRLSYLVGCPVEVRIKAGDESGVGRTDLALFDAYALGFMLSAKRRDPLRFASFTIEPHSEAAMITTEFSSEEPMALSDEILAWEGLASERNMYFEYTFDGGHLRVSFHPLRRDWSYLGLKQKPSFI